MVPIPFIGQKSVSRWTYALAGDLKKSIRPNSGRAKCAMNARPAASGLRQAVTSEAGKNAEFQRKTVELPNFWRGFPTGPLTINRWNRRGKSRSVARHGIFYRTFRSGPASRATGLIRLAAVDRIFRIPNGGSKTLASAMPTGRRTPVSRSSARRCSSISTTTTRWDATAGSNMK